MLVILLIRVLDNEWLIVAVIGFVMGCTAAVGALNAALTNDLIQIRSSRESQGAKAVFLQHTSQ